MGLNFLDPKYCSTSWLVPRGRRETHGFQMSCFSEAQTLRVNSYQQSGHPLAQARDRLSYHGLRVQNLVSDLDSILVSTSFFFFFNCRIFCKLPESLSPLPGGKGLHPPPGEAGRVTCGNCLARDWHRVAVWRMIPTIITLIIYRTSLKSIPMQPLINFSLLLIHFTKHTDS